MPLSREHLFMPLVAVLPVFITILVLVWLALFDRKFHRQPAIARTDSTSKNWIYVDRDGSGPIASASALWQRCLAGISSLATLGVVLAKLLVMNTCDVRGLVDCTYAIKWSGIGWAGVAVLAMLFAVSEKLITRYNLGLAVTLAIVPMLTYELTEILLSDSWGTQSSPLAYLNHSQVAIALALCAAAVSVRRRPQLLREGRPVIDDNSGSLLSKLTFAWGWPLLFDARKNGRLEIENLPRLEYSLQSTTLASRLMNRLGADTKLWLPLFKDRAGMIVLQTTVVLARAGTLYVPSVALNKLLRLLEDESQDSEQKTRQAAFWAFVIIAASIVSVFLQAWDEWLTWALGTTALTSQLYNLIFRKCLRMEDSKRPTQSNDNEADKHTTSGHDDDDDDDEEEEENEESNEGSAMDKKMKRNITNLLGVDVERVAEYLSQCTQLPCSFLEVVWGIGFLISVLGWKSTAIGLVVPVIIYPIHHWSSKAYSKAEEETMEAGDEKSNKVTEMLHAIKQIKFTATEDRWRSIVTEARTKELAAIRHAYHIEIVLSSAWDATPIFFGAAALASYALIHGDLPASVAFTALSILELVQFAISIVPHNVVELVNARVSMRRIEQHLERLEKRQYLIQSDTIKLSGASLAWTLEDATSESPFILRDLNLEFPTGEMSVVSGLSGSGKSLLLAALSGEAALISGKIYAPSTPDCGSNSTETTNGWIDLSSRAFVAQSPWLENASIRDNILFGLPRDDERYEQVVHACALEDDLLGLDDGDETEVGALGINLSGGQRLRLTLARALYSRAGILILDDIFSAVDANVGRHILEKGLLGQLCWGRTIVVATHHAELVTPMASYCVRVAAGTAVGTRQNTSARTATNTSRTNKSGGTLRSTLSETDTQSTDQKMSAPAAKPPRKFVQDEARQTGSVKSEIYRRYLQAAGGVYFWIPISLFFVASAAEDLAKSYVVKLWTEKSGNASGDYVASQHHTELFYLCLFVGLSVVGMVLITLKTYVLFMGTLSASKTLFDQMNDALLASPLRWIERIPIGRMLNRYVADFEHVDQSSQDIDVFLTYSLKVVAIVCSAMFVSLWMALPAVSLILFAVGLTIIYLPGARELKRIESTTRSPIIDHFTSAVGGLATIRTFGRNDDYVERMAQLIDTHASATLNQHMTTSWMSIHQGLLGSVFLSCVVIWLVHSRAGASLTGFILSFAMSYSETVSFAIWKCTSLEMDMNSAERIMEYIDVESETVDGIEPREDWPSRGHVSVKDLEVAYDDGLASVLKGVTFEIHPKERVGVVGRTGSGKSTLILALFRFLEQRTGTIEIDGIDISTVPLFGLRTRLSLIPQDPVLFTGTLRSNLDPFGRYTDEELMDKLRSIQHTPDQAAGQDEDNTSGYPTGLQNSLSRAINDLDHDIARGGSNVSHGQRQLICLARAMLEQPKIMMLDEATSAVDFDTDGVIQRNLREKFKQSTLIVVAHRLGTIADFDKVLVMGSGRVLEFGQPAELYRAQGTFAEMVDQSGDRTALLEKMGL